MKWSRICENAFIPWDGLMRMEIMESLKCQSQFNTYERFWNMVPDSATIKTINEEIPLGITVRSRRVGWLISKEAVLEAQCCVFLQFFTFSPWTFAIKSIKQSFIAMKMTLPVFVQLSIGHIILWLTLTHSFIYSFCCWVTLMDGEGRVILAWLAPWDWINVKCSRWGRKLEEGGRKKQS